MAKIDKTKCVEDLLSDGLCTQIRRLRSPRKLMGLRLSVNLDRILGAEVNATIEQLKQGGASGLAQLFS